MRYQLMRFLLLASVLVLITFGEGPGSPAFGSCSGPIGECGGLNAVCQCGNRVRPGLTTLAADLNCPEDVDGLFVGSDVTLKLAGRKIQGHVGPSSGSCSAGIVVDANATNVVVMQGEINGFEFGVEGSRVSGSKFSQLTITDAESSGIELTGCDGNTIQQNTIDASTPRGAAFIGGIRLIDCTGNTVRYNTTDGIGGGILVRGGSRNRVLSNDTLNSVEESSGIVIDGGECATVQTNNSLSNTEDGLTISGTKHSVISNDFNDNDDFGIFVDGGCTGCFFQTNDCLRSGTAPSSPPALCNGRTGTRPAC